MDHQSYSCPSLDQSLVSHLECRKFPRFLQFPVELLHHSSVPSMSVIY
uniref:Uncharacterized protein n=1 Tax=Arundo donax TaxID=35708 RepID=A0A0A9EJB5_ARUDO